MSMMCSKSLKMISVFRFFLLQDALRPMMSTTPFQKFKFSAKLTSFFEENEHTRVVARLSLYQQINMLFDLWLIHRTPPPHTIFGACVHCHAALLIKHCVVMVCVLLLIV